MAVPSIIAPDEKTAHTKAAQAPVRRARPSRARRLQKTHGGQSRTKSGRKRQAQNEAKRSHRLRRPAARFRVYGLTILSDIALPCPRAPRTARAHLRLRRSGPEDFSRARRACGLSPSPRSWFECTPLPDGSLYLRWKELFEFLVSPDARVIRFRAMEDATDETLTAYLLGTVVSFTLLSLDCEPLHSTAVVVDGSALAFVGDCGMGKSTLGAAFLARGYPVLTDDVLSIDAGPDGCVAHAGPSRIKLYPAIARRVLARTGRTRMNPGTQKLILPLGPRDAVLSSAPLKAIYVLHRPRTRGRAPAIEPLTGQRAFRAVAAAAFNLIRTDKARLARHFENATTIARMIPVRRLTYPRMLSRLDEVCAAVIADSRAL